MIDTLKLYNKLKEAGMSEKQADAYASGLAKVRTGKIDTMQFRKELIEAGMLENQAEVIAQSIKELIDAKQIKIGP